MIEYKIEEIKAVLEKKEFALFNRQTGKSTALIEFVHDHHGAEAVVICADNKTAGMMARLYNQKFPNEELPVFCGPFLADRCIRGNAKKIFIDEPHLVPFKVLVDISDSGRLEGAVGSKYVSGLIFF